MLALTGRTVAVTGAARGIGAAVAAAVVRRGGLDVTDEESYTQWLELAQVDVLVNAGVTWVGPYDEEPEAAGRRMMDVDFWGVARGTRLVLLEMLARGSGHVVTVASLAS